MEPGRGDLDTPPVSTKQSRAVPGTPHSPKDVLAGLMFVVIGLGFTAGAMTYGIGSANQLGPGSFPLVLGLSLTGLGAFIGARGLADGEAGLIGSVPWRAVALVVGAVIVFGLTVRSLGLAPATFLAAFMSALASRRTTLPMAVLIAVGLTVVSVLVFVFALSLRLPLFPSFFGR
jgi:Tripartite tricarboxylate transporter TctB family